MIRVYLNDTYKNWWFITLPHEINNEFLWNARISAESWQIQWIDTIPSFNDFWAPIKFSLKELDILYTNFEILEENLDEIIKVVPLPQKIWGWEWYNKQFVFLYEDWIKETNKYLPYLSNKEIQDIINRENMIQEPTNFKKEDMLLIISLIKKKILEAQEKWETLVFSWD